MTVFLLTLQKSGNVRESCEKAGITRQNAYIARQRHQLFKAKWAEAMEDAVDMLRKVAWRRATRSQNPSDKLLMFLLEAHDPMYRRNSEMSAGTTFNFVFNETRYSVRTAEDLEALPTEVLERIQNGDYIVDVDYKLLDERNE